MGTYFECLACGLIFMVGGLPIARDTFLSYYFYVCAACGTCHKITSERTSVTPHPWVMQSGAIMEVRTYPDQQATSQYPDHFAAAILQG
jgi:hypothetical protein